MFNIAPRTYILSILVYILIVVLLYFDKIENTLRLYFYNSSLGYAQNGDIETSLNTLPKSLPEYEYKRLELLWDLLYRRKESLDTVKSLYIQARALQSNPILEKKINILEEQTRSQASDNSGSEHTEYKKIQQNIENTQNTRQENINPYRSLEKNMNTDIISQDSLFNTFWQDERDW